MTFTIITTVLNNEKFILDCLKSVQKQNFSKKKLEHLIIDGGSSDQTIEIIKKFKKKNNYIKLFQKKNFSIYQAVNFGIKSSKNKYIGLLHSDDFFFNKNVLSIIQKNFTKNNDVKAIYSNINIVSRHNKKKILRYFKSKQLSKKDYLKYEHPPHTSLFLEKNIFKKYGLYKEKFKIASDFDFMLRIFGISEVKSLYLDKILVIMRSGGTSTKSLKNIIVSNYEVIKSIKENNLKINLIYIFFKILRKISQVRLFN